MYLNNSQRINKKMKYAKHESVIPAFSHKMTNSMFVSSKYYFFILPTRTHKYHLND